MKILLVSTQPLSAARIVRVIEADSQHTVITAHSLSSALELAANVTVELVLIESVAPSSLAEARQALSAALRLPSTAVIALTVSVDTVGLTAESIVADTQFLRLPKLIEKWSVAQNAAVTGQSSLVDRALEQAFADRRSFVLACSTHEPFAIVWGNRHWNEWNHAQPAKFTHLLHAEGVSAADQDRLRFAAVEAIREHQQVVLALRARTAPGVTAPVQVKLFVAEGGERLWVLWQFSEVVAQPNQRTELLPLMLDAVRNPLAEARGALGMLSGGLFGRLEDRVNELVENAIVQLDRSTRFLDDSVIIERVLRDDFKLSLQATKADDLVLAALNAHEISSSDQPQYPIPSATSLRVMVDVRRVHQALVAFLEYSKQYCAEGSAPTIFVERHEQMVRFTITATKVKSALESTVVDRNESPIWLRVRVARLLVELHNGTWGQSSQESHWVAFPRLASGPSSALRALAKEVVQELRAELLDTLPQQAEAIRLGLEPECSLELRRRGLVIAHNLRGTAGSCGLSELGVAAGQVEDCYRLTQSGERPDEKLIVAALDALNQAMKHALG